MKATIMYLQKDISGDQQALLNRARKEAKNNPLTMEEHKRAIKEVMSRYKKDLW